MTYLINGSNTRAGLRGGGPIGTYHVNGLGDARSDWDGRADAMRQAAKLSPFPLPANALEASIVAALGPRPAKSSAAVDPRAAAIAAAKAKSLATLTAAKARFKAMTDEQLVAAANMYMSQDDTINLKLVMDEARGRNVQMPVTTLSTSSTGDAPTGSGSNTMLYAGGAALLLALLVLRK